jgi:hypothetical protein
MSNPDQNQPDNVDMELSPEAKAAFGKARRSFAWSISIMLLGFMAIGFAIVYRVMRDAPPPATVATVSVPVGSEVLSALNIDGTVQVTYRAGESTLLNVYDSSTGTLLRTIEIAKL